MTNNPLTKVFEISIGAPINPPVDAFSASDDGEVTIETGDGKKITLSVSRGVFHPVYVRKVFSVKKKLSLGNLFKKFRVFGYYHQ